jgi:predicted transcriptional regulator
MTNEIVKFETALLASEKGFNYMKANCYGDNLAYDTGVHKGKLIQAGTTLNNVLAPNQSLLQRWLREFHEISVKVDDFYTNSKIRYDYIVCKLGHQEESHSELYETYEEALEVALVEALNMIKNGKKKK